eukprot:3792767-Rhodomonas_salina.1
MGHRIAPARQSSSSNRPCGNPDEDQLSVVLLPRRCRHSCQPRSSGALRLVSFFTRLTLWLVILKCAGANPFVGRWQCKSASAMKHSAHEVHESCTVFLLAEPLLLLPEADMQLINYPGTGVTAVDTTVLFDAVYIHTTGSTPHARRALFKTDIACCCHQETEHTSCKASPTRLVRAPTSSCTLCQIWY